MTVEDVVKLLPDNVEITACPGAFAIPINKNFQLDLDAYGQYKVIGIKAFRTEETKGAATRYELTLSVKYVREAKEDSHDEKD